MATNAQKVDHERGGRPRTSFVVPLIMVAGAETDVTFSIPVGSRFVTFSRATPAAFSGAPTSVNLTIGKTTAGADYVAAVNVAAQSAPSAATLVATGAADLDSAPSQTWHATLVATGGTAPAGTCDVLVEYTPPAGIA